MKALSSSITSMAEELIDTSIATFMKVILRKVFLTDTGSILGWMVLSTLANGLSERRKAMVSFTYGKTSPTKANGLTMWKWVKDSMNGKTETLTRGILQMIWETGEEFIAGRMEISFRVTGKITGSMDRCSSLWMDVSTISKLLKGRLLCDFWVLLWFK